MNGLFEMIEPKHMKPAEILSFVNLFNDVNFRDACHVLTRFQLAQTPRSHRSLRPNSTSHRNVE